MSTLTTIQSSDLITDSRAVINDNFTALNTDKIETSYIDDDTTLSANSDSKIATQKAVKAYVDSGGNPNASTTQKGIVEIATQAEYDAGTETGGTGAKLVVTPALVKGSQVPIVRTYTTVATKVGDETTRIDITNTSGTTFRYTWDGTGTDPGFTATTPATGDLIYITSVNFSAGNRGIFTVTASGTNYFEVSNASGVAENDKLMGNTGLIQYQTASWTKPTGLRYVIAECQGAGGKGGAGANGAISGGGGGGGGYSKKLISASTLGATEKLMVGFAGNSSISPGGVTVFGNYLYATGGFPGDSGANNGGGGVAGLGYNGDINCKGGGGGGGGSNGTAENDSGVGGHSFYGGGGESQDTADTAGNAGGVYGGGGSGGAGTGGGGTGAQGILIITEYY